MMLTLLMGLTALISMVALYMENSRRLHRLDERIRKLEEAGQKRINYRSLEEIENAMTALALHRTDLELQMNIVDNAVVHLSRAHTPTRK